MTTVADIHQILVQAFGNTNPQSTAQATNDHQRAYREILYVDPSKLGQHLKRYSLSCEQIWDENEYISLWEFRNYVYALPRLMCLTLNSETHNVIDLRDLCNEINFVRGLPSNVGDFLHASHNDHLVEVFAGNLIECNKMIRRQMLFLTGSQLHAVIAWLDYIKSVGEFVDIFSDYADTLPPLILALRGLPNYTD